MRPMIFFSESAQDGDKVIFLLYLVNVFIISHDVHKAFDRFGFWLVNYSHDSEVGKA